MKEKEIYLVAFFANHMKEKEIYLRKMSQKNPKYVLNNLLQCSCCEYMLTYNKATMIVV
jgi:hypothetical protein